MIPWWLCLALVVLAFIVGFKLRGEIAVWLRSPSGGEPIDFSWKRVGT